MFASFPDRFKRLHSMSAVLLTSVVYAAISFSPTVAQDYDIVIKNGRVIDPETKLDAIRNVGIINGQIDVVTDTEIHGKDTIDASGHVVAPGFIDFHMHGQDPYSIKIAETQRNIARDSRAR